MTKIKVNDMTCSHCEKAIKAELAKGDPNVKIEVNLRDKIIEVENLPGDRALFMLKEIGYTPELMK